jgi:hypothetical protein
VLLTYAYAFAVLLLLSIYLHMGKCPVFGMRVADVVLVALCLEFPAWCFGARNLPVCEGGSPEFTNLPVVQQSSCTFLHTLSPFWRCSLSKNE